MLRIFAIVVSLLFSLSCVGAAKKGSSTHEVNSESKKPASTESEVVDLMAGEEAKVIPVLEVEKPKKKPKEVSKSTTRKEGPISDSELVPEIKEIKDVVSKFQKTQAVGMKVEKKVHLALMDEDRFGKGRLWYSKGRLKLEIEKPEDSLLILDDEIVWVVSKMPEEFGGTVQVTKMKAAKIKKSNALLAVLFGDESVWDKFAVVSSDEKKGVKGIILKPLKEANLADVTKLRVVLSIKSKELTEIVYWDELENETSYKFSQINFGMKLSKKHFKYTPPKGAEISEM